jgi:hypothetical protein
MSEQVSEFVEDVTGDDPDHTGPIPVEVANAVRVQEFPARTINTGQAVLGAQPARVVGALRSRVRLHLRAAGGVVVLGGHAGVTPGTGFALADGQTLALETSGDVFAMTEAGGPVVLHWLTENRDG